MGGDEQFLRSLGIEPAEIARPAPDAPAAYAPLTAAEMEQVFADIRKALDDGSWVESLRQASEHQVCQPNSWGYCITCHEFVPSPNNNGRHSAERE